MSGLGDICEDESIRIDRDRLRDGFASAAMTGMMSDSHTASMTTADIARVAYEVQMTC